jgi:hypothetical protein
MRTPTRSGKRFNLTFLFFIQLWLWLHASPSSLEIPSETFDSRPSHAQRRSQRTFVDDSMLA